MAKGKKKVYFSVRTVDMKKANGLDSVRCARNGIHL